MSDVGVLTHEERVFFAGSIRDLILEDGSIAEGELDDLDSLSRRLHFSDYETCLEEFEKTVPDEQAFTAAARSITRPVARQLILDALYEMQLRKAIPGDEHKGVFGRLSELWQPPEEGDRR
jgi:hypothetical protein